MDHLYTTKELTELFHVHEKTVLRWLSTGNLQGSKISHRWLVTEDALQEFIARGLKKGYTIPLHAWREQGLSRAEGRLLAAYRALTREGQAFINDQMSTACKLWTDPEAAAAAPKFLADER